MSNEEQIIELVEKFLRIARELFDNNSIDRKIYNELTCNKMIFLKEISDKKAK